VDQFLALLELAMPQRLLVVLVLELQSMTFTKTALIFAMLEG